MPTEVRTVEINQQTGEQTTKVETKRDCKDYYRISMIVLRVLAGIFLLLAVTAFVIIVKLMWNARGTDFFERVFMLCSNLGMMTFCVGCFLAECQFVWFFKKIPSLYFNGVRGCLEIFIGVTIIADAKLVGALVAADTGGDSDALKTFVLVCGFLIFSIGWVWVFMAIFCVRNFVKLDSEREIESHLLAMETGGTVVHENHVLQQSSSVIVASPTSSASGSFDNSEELATNLATALGLSYVVARARYGGKDGAKKADEYAKEHNAGLKL